MTTIRRDSSPGEYGIEHNPGYDFLRLVNFLQETDRNDPHLPFAGYLIPTVAFLAACCAIEGYVNTVGSIVSRSRNNLSSMKYRRDLGNGNNSQQLLEAINQGICDSLERQLDYAHAPTIAGHLNPGPAQQYPKVDDEQCQPDQQQSQGRIARTSAGPHLMQLPITRLDPEAPPVQLKELMRLDRSQAVDGVGEVLDPVLPIASRAVVADDDHVGGVSCSRAAIERVARRITAPSIKQAFDTAYTAARRDRDEVRHTPLPEHSQHRDRAKAFVAVEPLEAHSKFACQRD